MIIMLIYSKHVHNRSVSPQNAVHKFMLTYNVVHDLYTFHPSVLITL